MTPLKILKAVVAMLEKLECTYCLIGGHAASLYRTQERFTRDVDFALIANNINKSCELAEECIAKLGMKPMYGFVPGQTEQSKEQSEINSICFVCSAPEEGEFKGILDILLPVLPWVTNAVARAQYNKLDLGFANVPVITPEDLIISKCYAFRNAPDRFQDLDDLKDILQSLKDLDYVYLYESLGLLSLAIPKQVSKFISSSK